LSWDDSQLLLRVIEERFTALHAGNMQADEIWTRYFCETVKGKPTKEYLLERILPRPRDFVYMVKAALSNAVNLRHTRVEVADVLAGEQQYSQFAVESLLVEHDLPVGSLEPIIFEFIASTSVLEYGALKNLLLKAGVTSEHVGETIAGLCELRFLGIEVGTGEFRFADDPQESRKIEVLSRKLQEQTGRLAKFMINPAYRAFLEVKEE
jgi:hypothetical protein